MTRILVVYHSQTGRTETMARAVADGAKAIERTEVVLKKAGEATLDDLLACSGLAIGTPENFGYMSGMIKDFFDRTPNIYRCFSLTKKYTYLRMPAAGK